MRASQLALWRKVLDNAIEKDSKGLLRPDSLAKHLVTLSKEEGITDDDVLGEIAVLFIAGHETTAHTLSFFIHAICKHQEIQALNRIAVIEAMSKEDYVPGVLPPIVDATLKESMRMTPVAPNGLTLYSCYTYIAIKDIPFIHHSFLIHIHTTTHPSIYISYVEGSMREVTQKKGVQLTDDIYLPRGTWIQVPLFALHNYSKNWQLPSPLEFHPSRWLRKADVETKDDSAIDEIDDDTKKEQALYLEDNVTSIGSYVGWGPTQVSTSS